MGLPLVLLNRRRRGGGVAFSPASLFAANETGVWYDPSDLTTLFQDTAGTTPVTTAAQTVALGLDKSRGLVLGPELVTNGTFETDLSGWTNLSTGTATLSWNAGAMRMVTSGSSNRAMPETSISTVSGRTYLLTLSWTVVSGTPDFALNLSTTSNGTTFASSTNAITRFVFTATSSTTFVRVRGANFGISDLDNISVRELPGIHATQSSSSFRPAYQTTPQRFNFDGSDDRLVFNYSPTTSGSLAVRINGATASRVAIGSQGATDGRCFLALASDGSLGAGIGTQSTATIKGSTDIRNTWTTGIVTWDGTTVRLYQNGAEVYSGAQSGAVNTTAPMDLGCLNNNGTRSAFWSGGLGAAIALGRVMTPAEITSLHQFWSNIA